MYKKKNTEMGLATDKTLQKRLLNLKTHNKNSPK
jgi:hypothetical protein